MPIWSPAFFGSGAGSSGFVVTNSVYLDSASTEYLARTLGSGGNTKTWTFSTWAKQGKNWANRVIFAQGDYNGDYTSLYFDGDSKLYYNDYGASGGNRNTLLKTDGVLRDPTAWSHFLIINDTSSAVSTATDRSQIWINGVRVSQAYISSKIPAEDATSTLNTAGDINIGRYPSNDPGSTYDGYLAQTAFVGGTAYAASNWGELDDNGVWIPKDITGLTFGTNGFLLQYKETGTSADSSGIGADTSGNNLHFSVTNIAGAQSTTDTCSDDASSNIGNYPTWSPIDKDNITLSNGNLSYSVGSSNVIRTRATIAIPSSGKYYYEQTITTDAGSSGTQVGIYDASAAIGNNTASGLCRFVHTTTGQKTSQGDGGGGASYGSAFSNGDVAMIAVDMDNNKIWIGKQGTFFNSGDPAAGSNAMYDDLSGKTWVPATGTANSSTSQTGTVNFGATAFAHTPPTGFKALNTANLPAPTVTDPSKYFQTVIYTGDTNNNRNITGFQDAAGNNITPDWVWIKSRSHAVSHYLQDVVRGFGGSKELLTDGTQVEGSQGTGNGYIGGVVAGGFTAVDGSANDVYVNENGRTYVAWMWKAGGSASSNSDGSITTSVSAADHGGFSIATWTGNGSAGATIGHGLSRKPAMGIFKRKSLAQDWAVYHEGSDASAPEDKYLNLNLTDGVGDATWLNDTAPTTSIWTLGTSGYVNTSSETFVGYFFARTPGLIGIGTYTGNGSADGPAVICDDGASGFAPAWLMIKNINDAGTDWRVIDSVRDGGINDGASNAVLNAGRATNESDASPGTIIDKLATGFKIRGTDGNTNTSGKIYIYLSFSENPLGGVGVAQARAR